MSAAGHTPGPWAVVGRVHSSGEAVRIEGRNLPMIGYQVADVLDANGNPENEANARLIAAAPELLEALEAITDQLERIGDTREHKDGQFITAARAAISKATAQQPESTR